MTVKYNDCLGWDLGEHLHVALPTIICAPLSISREESKYIFPCY